LTVRDKRDDYKEHQEITVETLSSPPIDVKPAPLGKRAAATTIDSLILLAAWSILEYLAGTSLMTKAYLLTGQPFSIDPILPLHLTILTFVYYSLTEASFGATFGKMIMKIHVLELDGDPCSFRAAVVRNALRLIDWLPLLYLLGAAVVLTSRKRQRIGDRLARTVVSPVQEKDINPPPAPFLFH
jgi:uncharacterized RDD family membrane protein YckC